MENSSSGNAERVAVAVGQPKSGTGQAKQAPGQSMIVFLGADVLRFAQHLCHQESQLQIWQILVLQAAQQSRDLQLLLGIPALSAACAPLADRLELGNWEDEEHLLHTLSTCMPELIFSESF